MRASGLVAICVLVVVTVVYSADPAKPSGQPQKALGESGGSALFPALRKFVDSPGTKADRQFVSVEKGKEGALRFRTVPGGWSTFGDEKPDGSVILLDKDGFRTLIRLRPVAGVKAALIDHIQYGPGYGGIVLMDQLFGPGDTQVPRVVTCGKLKGDTQLRECRYFETDKGVVCAELVVFDWPTEKRTLGHLLSHLRAHYGKYEGVCQQVADLAVNKP